MDSQGKAIPAWFDRVGCDDARLNGFEMKKQMSVDPLLASIPFIFLTARAAAEDRVAGMRDGADDYVTKPFVTEELMARIEAVLRRVKTEQERGREQVQQATAGWDG